ncbi:alpha-L-fucosidase (plasmid) [Streptomyces clavuligerus]|nr:alpha-L-fucosidase [Streptomyces clavuligerus]ANW22461.1 alpha-L-fucosidase [Streptomyces clavuligerus]AXU17365.1 alpha-L-fucosidase [Streptomyces clavuligerus]MBY6306978.1 alpha-L-fucosidase [Streptomyces clavuligerus]QCS10438.1 alpha-L-fucosidase [Streptomyces clavuligerus]QPJ97521.1 alpha-L-fucosidase [Streptomyces clavuligerus]
MHSRTALSLLLGAALLIVGCPSAQADPAPPPPPPPVSASAPGSGQGTNYAVDDPFTSARTAWWRQDRFGMFIHFGAYSQLEGEYTRPDGTVCRDAEWIKRSCAVPMPEYERIARDFNPSAFDAEAVVKAAKDAGQRYIVITSKHHDGYAMWPTRQNTWNLRDHSSFDSRRDILAELKRAADAAGVKLGFYYSIWDWHDPDFPDPATFPRYKQRMYAQLKELIDNYDPALLWFDGQWDAVNPVNRWSPQDGAELQKYLRGLDPGLIINNRVGKKRVVDGDYGTPEQTIPAAPVEGQPWESCMTLNGHWGYAKYDTAWKPTGTLVRNLLDIAGRGGDYLLNVGPDRLGRIPGPSVDRLREMGDWLSGHGRGRAVHGAGHTGLVADPDWGAVSRRGNSLYASVTSWPSTGTPLHLRVLAPFQVKSATVLGSTQSVAVRRAGDGLDLTPSGGPVGTVATVIKLDIAPPAPAPVVGTGRGLKAEIWANENFAGPPVLARVDPTVNESYRFDGSPAPQIPADNFATRWTGYLQPRHSGPHTLTTVSDDSVRVWIDGQLLIDDSVPHDPRTGRATVTLTAGHRHAITVEHTERTGEAHMKLLWSSPYESQRVIPATQLHTP